MSPLPTILLLAAMPVALCSTADIPPVHPVLTDAGPVLPVLEYSRAGRPYYAVRGIPYARPPIGRLRFAVKRVSALGRHLQYERLRVITVQQRLLVGNHPQSIRLKHVLREQEAGDDRNRWLLTFRECPATTDGPASYVYYAVKSVHTVFYCDINLAIRVCLSARVIVIVVCRLLIRSGPNCHDGDDMRYDPNSTAEDGTQSRACILFYYVLGLMQYLKANSVATHVPRLKPDPAIMQRRVCGSGNGQLKARAPTATFKLKRQPCRYSARIAI
ncbi:hypothetical protein AAG570_005051 [Ranatra chinensis]|uniref:Carboxylesterase type B domain-containing protein n=1 Tax=Ranatra chinensis TaxID=642074 RepID=A0ABD0YL40_9HEMI